MPIPSSSIKAAMHYLKKDKPSMSHKQKIAIALSVTGESKESKKHEKNEAVKMALKKAKER